MTVAEVITIVRKLLAEPEAGFFTTDDMIGWINEGVYYILSDPDFATFMFPDLFSESSLSIDTSDDSITLPADLLRIISFRAGDYYSILLFPTDQYYNIDQISVAAMGNYITAERRGDKVYIKSDIPSGVSSITLYYIKKPTTLTATTDTIELPDYICTLLLPYVVTYLAKWKDVEYNNPFLMEYENRKKRVTITYGAQYGSIDVMKTPPYYDDWDY